MNWDELSFLDEAEDAEAEDFNEMLEREREEVQRILQSLEPNKLREN